MLCGSSENNHEKVSKYDQEMPQSHTTDLPTVPQGRSKEQQQQCDTQNTIKVMKPALSSTVG